MGRGQNICANCGSALLGRSQRRFCSVLCANRFLAPNKLRKALEAVKEKRRKNMQAPTCKKCGGPLIIGVNARMRGNRLHGGYECFACAQQRTKKRNATVRVEVFLAYGGRCVCCEEFRQEFLTIDHVHGYQNGHGGEPRQGLPLYRWLKRQHFPQERFRILCLNCNFSLAHYGYCPHGNVSGPQLSRRLSLLEKM